MLASQPVQQVLAVQRGQPQVRVLARRPVLLGSRAQLEPRAVAGQQEPLGQQEQVQRQAGGLQHPVDLALEQQPDEVGLAALLLQVAWPLRRAGSLLRVEPQVRAHAPQVELAAATAVRQQALAVPLGLPGEERQAVPSGVRQVARAGSRA